MINFILREKAIFSAIVVNDKVSHSKNTNDVMISNRVKGEKKHAKNLMEEIKNVCF